MPLTVAGLRFCVAALLLAPFAAGKWNAIRSFPPRLWLRLFLLGLCAYAVGNSAVFWSLRYLPATTVSFVMSLSPLLVLAASVRWLKERPTALQGIGVIVTLAGGGLFFSPGWGAGNPAALGVVAAGLVAFSTFGILGREIARDRQMDTLALTLIPLAFGGTLLLIAAAQTEGPIHLPIVAWAIVLWLGVINTALAYLLYNHSLQVLTALEMNTLLNLSSLGTSGFAWLLLGEGLSGARLAGLVIVVVGVSLVQGKGRAGGANTIA